MTTPTTAPIAGNQNFSSVSNVAAQVPTLFVGELEASDAAVTSLTLDDGQVVTTQGTPPTATAIVGGAPPSSAAVLVYPDSTDTSGRLQLYGTPIANDGITLVFKRPFPVGTDVSVVLTACDEASAASITKGVWVSTDATSFKVVFENWVVAGIPVAVDPCFNYFVTAFAPN